MMSKNKFPNHLIKYKVSGVLLCCDKKVCLVKRSDKKEDGAGLWSIPGGKHDDGEDCRDCVVREVTEELRVELQGNLLRHVSTYYYERDSDPGYRVVYNLFLYNCITLPKIYLNEENEEYGWFTYEEILVLDTFDGIPVLVKESFQLLGGDNLK